MLRTKPSKSSIIPTIGPDDIALILKSGSVVRGRLRAQIETFASTRTSSNTLVIADYAENGRIPVIDVVAPLRSIPAVVQSEKYALYLDQTTGNQSVLPGTHNSGWKIDAYKFIPGWQLSAESFPEAKWFIATDDDTWVFWQNLYQLLSLLDHNDVHYFGNVAEYGATKQDFVHGGSIIVASQAAVRHRFLDKKSSLEKYNVMVNDVCCGDAVLAMAFAGVGVLPTDTLSKLFTSLGPTEYRLDSQSLCLPLVGLHAVLPEEMHHLHQLPSARSTRLELFTNLTDGADRAGWDYINISGDYKKRLLRWPPVEKTADYCRDVCHHNNEHECLAWTFNHATKDCWLSSSFVVGRLKLGHSSGINRVKIATTECHQSLYALAERDRFKRLKLNIFHPSTWYLEKFTDLLM